MSKYKCPNCGEILEEESGYIGDEESGWGEGFLILYCPKCKMDYADLINTLEEVEK